ncbi:hypothetical protein [Rubrivivax gelatinosus]|uniref:hypothetical protein n=1 Tax=Rubrivivax gelatinosus TaxID=28068 RepID=UPI001908E6AB|nr:hypothetical protein [Rubrivivax gelatinosus]
MPSRSSSFKTLEQTLSGLEQLVLHASDKNLLRDTQAASDAAREVEQLIARRVAPLGQVKKRGRGVGGVSDFGFLAGMRSSGSGAPVSAVYGAKKQPTSDEVEQVIEKLLSPSANKKKVQKKFK